MRRNARWLSLFLSFNLLASSVAPVALAQGKAKPLREELAPEQRKDYDLAMTLFGDRNYRGAIIQFQRIYDATKNPRVLANIGRAYQELNNGPRAIQFYERALSEGSGKISAADAQVYRDAIADLRKTVSTLDVQTNIPGAVVNIDGEDMGTTPLPKPLDVSIATHVVKVSKDGFRDSTRNVDVARGVPAVAKFELIPERLMADVTVTAEGAPRANIRIDGVEMGPSPYRGKVEIGKRHKFEAYAPGFVTAEQSLDVPKQEPLTVTLRMSEQRSEGRVAIIGRPAGAMIYIDQKVVGTDKWEGVLPAGGHQVKIHKDGYVDHVQEIGVANDQVRTVEATLRQDAQRGAVVWAVGAALVVIGGTLVAVRISSGGRDDAAKPGTFTPGLIGTWLHR